MRLVMEGPLTRQMGFTDWKEYWVVLCVTEAGDNAELTIFESELVGSGQSSQFLAPVTLFAEGKGGGVH